MDGLLTEINRQLSDQGLYIKSGEVRIVDASVIEAKNCRPNKNKQGKSTQDLEANWNIKAGSDGKRKSTYGYKAHMNVDEDGFIKSSNYTAGMPQGTFSWCSTPIHLVVHDSNCFTGLLNGNESADYADSAYQSQAHNQWLKGRHIENRIIRRVYRNKPLTQRLWTESP